MDELDRRLTALLSGPVVLAYPLPPGESEDAWRSACFSAVRTLRDRGLATTLDSAGRPLGASLLGLTSEALCPTLEAEVGRARLVGELVRNAVQPGRINQGLKYTCSVTCVESYLAETSPAEYVRLLAGLMADAGKVALRNGELLQRNVHLFRWSKREWRRNPVSRLFQAAAMAYAYPELVYRDSLDSFQVPGRDTITGSGDATGTVGLDLGAFDRFLEGITGEKWDVLSETQSRFVAWLIEQGLPAPSVPVLSRDGLDIIVRSARAGEATFVTLDTSRISPDCLPPDEDHPIALPHKVRVLSVDPDTRRIMYDDPLDPLEPWLEGVEVRIEDREGRCSMSADGFRSIMLEVSYKPMFWDFEGGPKDPSG
jgi:hypothetical protein